MILPLRKCKSAWKYIWMETREHLEQLTETMSVERVSWSQERVWGKDNKRNLGKKTTNQTESSTDLETASDDDRTTNQHQTQSSTDLETHSDDNRTTNQHQTESSTDLDTASDASSSSLTRPHQLASETAPNCLERGRHGCLLYLHFAVTLRITYRNSSKFLLEMISYLKTERI